MDFGGLLHAGKSVCLIWFRHPISHSHLDINDVTFCLLIEKNEILFYCPDGNYVHIKQVRK